MLALAILLAASAHRVPRPAHRFYGSTLAEFRRFIASDPDIKLQLIPSARQDGPGLLYGGEVEGTIAVVRVFPEAGGLVREKVEVAIPSEDEPDEGRPVRLISRFLNEFVGRPQRDGLLRSVLGGLEANLLHNDRRSMSERMLGTRITLSFDNTPGEMVEVLGGHENWSYLFWRADIVRLP